MRGRTRVGNSPICLSFCPSRERVSNGLPQPPAQQGVAEGRRGKNAEGGTRTHTILLSLDFESSASASSATSAIVVVQSVFANRDSGLRRIAAASPYTTGVSESVTGGGGGEKGTALVLRAGSECSRGERGTVCIPFYDRMFTENAAVLAKKTAPSSRRQWSRKIGEKMLHRGEIFRC